MKNLFTIKQSTFAACILCALLVSSVSADMISVDSSSAALYAGRNVWVGNDSNVTGTSVAGRSITTGAEVQTDSLYSAGNISVGRENSIRGHVLSNGQANADRNLNYQGSSWTGNSVYLGRDAQFTGNVVTQGGATNIDRNANIQGSVLGNGSVWIGRNSNISGDASAGNGHRLSTDRRVNIGGSTASGSNNYDTYQMAATPAAPQMSAGSQRISGGNKSVTDLTAGDYGDLSIWGNNSTLNLSSGTYNVKSFWMSNNGEVNVDTSGGNVTLNIARSLSTGNNVEFRTQGSGSLTINVMDNDAWLGHDNAIEANAKIWDGNFGAGKNLDMVGSIFAARDINLDNRAVVDFAGQVVPEPNTLALVIAGGVWVLYRKNRAKKQTS